MNISMEILNKILHIDPLRHNLQDHHILVLANRLNSDHLGCSCERIGFVVAKNTK